jgi:putative FmdB family regulatory protein
MPIYEYECNACGERHEFIQKFSDAPKRKCPVCGKSRLRKLVSAAAFHLKGNGWYVTDFRDKKNGKDGKSAGKSDSTDGQSDSKSDGKSDTKSDTKSDGASGSTAESKSDAKSEPKADKKAAAKKGDSSATPAP